MSVRYAVTHGYRAHRDDIFAAALLRHSRRLPEGVPIYRREPSEEELADPSVIVFDIGRQHDVMKNNFDHHQDGSNEDCAFTLVAKALHPPGVSLSYHELFKGAPWYEAIRIQDTQGPGGLARSVGLSRIPEELSSPIEQALLAEMGAGDEFPEEHLRFLIRIIDNRIRTGLELREKHAWLDKNGLLLKINPDDPMAGLALVAETGPFGMESFIQAHPLQGAIVATVTVEPRNDGWCLHRRHCIDPKNLDFTRIKDEPEILFCHKGGYMCSVTRKTAHDRISELFRLAMSAKPR